MVVELRTLRITSDFDSSRYVAGMNQKSEADRTGAQTSKTVGAAIEDVKVKVSSAVPLIERLSRTYIDGYGSAAKFNSELLKLARSQDTNAASVEHLELIYGGLQKKFGLVADASDLAARGYTKLASAIETVNSRLNAQGESSGVSALAARIEQLRTQFDPTYVAAQRLSSELNDLAEAERLGVQITGGYERALEAIVLKHDAAAAAAKRQRDEYARLAQEGREALAADRFQAQFNRVLGVDQTTGLRASDSAGVFSEQLGRQEEIARLRAEQEASNFATALNQRFAFGGSATSAQASASVFSAEFARLDEIERLRAQQQGSTFTSDLNERIGVNGFGTSARASAAAFEEAARQSEELDRRVAALRAQIDPLAAAQNRLNAELAEYNDLAARGAISGEELVKAQIIARQRYEAYASEMQRQQKRGVGGLPGYQLTNLMYQGTDVLQSFALGMPFQQVLLQQGPQIAQIFAANGAAMKTLVSSIGATTVAITGVVAAIAIGAKAFNDYLVSMKAVESASDGLGRGMAGTAEQMEAAAHAGADAANISIKSARSMEAQFLRTGRIGSDNFEDLIAISRDFAATIGVDADKVGETLANMFADPAKAAQVLYQQYGLINAAVARQATNLAAQNRQSEAQAVLLNALPERLARAEEATTALGRAWHFVSTGASDAFDWMGKAIDRALTGPSLEERLQEAQRSRNAMSPSGILQFLSPGNALNLADIGNVDDLQEQVRRRNQLEFEQRRRAAEIARSRAATGLADTSGANSDLIQQERLRNEIAALRSGLGAEGVDDAKVNSAVEAKTRVLDALINRQQRTAELDRLEIQIQNERNPLLRAELEARRARLQMADQEVNGARISEESQRTRNRVVNETMATASANVRDMQAEIETRQRLNAQLADGTITASDANRMLQEEAALRPLVMAAAVAEGEEKKALTSIIEQLRRSYAELAAETKRSAAIAVIQGQSDQLEMLRAEISLVGQSAEARQKYIAVLEAEQRIRREGLSGAEADQIRQQAAELAMLRSALARANFNDNLSFEERQFGRSSRDQQIASRLRGAGLSEDLTGFEATRMRSLMQMQEIKESVTSFFTDFRQAMVSNGGNIGKSLAQAISNGLMNEANKIWDRLAEQFGSMLARALTGGTGTGTGIASTGIMGAVVGKAIGTNANVASTAAANDNVASGVGQAMGMVGRYRGAGVDPRLTDILQTAATRFPGFKVDATSGFRAGDPRFHGQGLATDVQLTDLATGKMLGNYQDASSFRAYEQFAQVSRQIQMEKYPELADKFRWGGYFSGGPGKYGALDTMHFDLGGAGMAGGSWAGGLTTAQASLWPGIQSQGMEASKALERLAANTNVASKGLDSLGGGLGQLGQSLSTMQFSSTSGGAVGQFGGLWGGIGKLFGGISPTSPLWAPNTTFGTFLGLSSGGYTGPGGVNEARGIVHAGEIVWSQHDISRAGGVGVVEAMRRGVPGYADGGIVADQRRPVASAARADWNSRTDRILSAANTNAGKSNGKMELHVHIDGANGDDHVRELTRQGVQEALSDKAVADRRGGFGMMQTRWANQKG